MTSAVNNAGAKHATYSPAGATEPTAQIQHANPNNTQTANSNANIHQALANTATTTSQIQNNDYSNSFANDPREIRQSKVRHNEEAKVDLLIAQFQKNIDALIAKLLNTQDPKQKQQLQEEAKQQVAALFNEQFNLLSELLGKMDAVIDLKHIRKERGAAYTARHISQEMALRFLKAFTEIENGNASKHLDLGSMLDQQQYQLMARIAVGGVLSAKAASVMLEACKNNKLKAEKENLTSKTQTHPDNEAAHDAHMRAVDINLGALVNDQVGDGNLAQMATDYMSFVNHIDYERILNGLQNGLPAAISRTTEWCRQVEGRINTLKSNFETVRQLNHKLGMSKENLAIIQRDIQNIENTLNKSLGTIRVEKGTRALREILLRESPNGLIDTRRAAAKTAMHALIMAYNGNFNANPHYANEKVWEQRLYNAVINKYKATANQELNKTKILKELAIIANELRANSHEPFRLHDLAKARGFDAELTNLLKDSLQATKPEQVHTAISTLSSIFASTSIHTAQIFERLDDPNSRNKDQHQLDANASLWIFNNLFQQPLLQASSAKGFNAEALTKFFENLTSNKAGNRSNPAMHELFNFIKASMKSDPNPKDIDVDQNLQKAEKYALYLYYLVMKYMPVNPKNGNGLHYMRLFSKLYLDPEFRRQLKLELSGAEQATKTQYNLLAEIDQAHKEKVNLVAKSLENDIKALIANNGDQHELYKLSIEYIKLEHDLRGLAQDPAHATEVGIGGTQANAYNMEGFSSLIPAIYDYNKSLALNLLQCYGQDRHNENKVNAEAEARIAQALGKHIEARLAKVQNNVTINTELDSVINEILEGQRPLAINQRSGLQYNSMREALVRIVLSKSTLSTEAKAIINKIVRDEESLEKLKLLKNTGGHIILDCKNKEQVSALQNIYEDNLVLSKLAGENFSKVLEAGQLKQIQNILSAQYLGIEQAEISDRDDRLKKQVLAIENAYKYLSDAKLASPRAIRAVSLRLEPQHIAAVNKSREETIKEAYDSVNRADHSILGACV